MSHSTDDEIADREFPFSDTEVMTDMAACAEELEKPDLPAEAVVAQFSVAAGCFAELEADYDAGNLDEAEAAEFNALSERCRQALLRRLR